MANDSGDKKIFAYRITDNPDSDENEYGSYDSVQDFTTLTAARNWDPRGVWSNGTTMYVVDDEDEKVYAYRLSDKARDPSRDIPLTSPNSDAYGAWSYGDTLYVTDTSDKAVYRYPLQHPSTGQPCISGTPQAYEGMVTAETNCENFADPNGLTSQRLRFSYQWIRSDGGLDTDIEGATERTYMPVLEDEGRRLKVRVRFFDNEGYEELRTSEASATVLPRPANIRATGQPSISGKVQEKQDVDRARRRHFGRQRHPRRRRVFLPVDPQRRRRRHRDRGQDRAHLQAGPGGRGQGAQGAGELHRQPFL